MNELFYKFLGFSFNSLWTATSNGGIAYHIFMVIDFVVYGFKYKGVASNEDLLSFVRNFVNTAVDRFNSGDAVEGSTAAADCETSLRRFLVEFDNATDTLEKSKLIAALRAEMGEPNLYFKDDLFKLAYEGLELESSESPTETDDSSESPTETGTYKQYTIEDIVRILSVSIEYECGIDYPEVADVIADSIYEERYTDSIAALDDIELVGILACYSVTDITNMPDADGYAHTQIMHVTDKLNRNHCDKMVAATARVSTRCHKTFLIVFPKSGTCSVKSYIPQLSIDFKSAAHDVLLKETDDNSFYRLDMLCINLWFDGYSSELAEGNSLEDCNAAINVFKSSIRNGEFVDYFKTLLQTNPQIEINVSLVLFIGLILCEDKLGTDTVDALLKSNDLPLYLFKPVMAAVVDVLNDHGLTNISVDSDTGASIIIERDCVA